MKPIKVIHSVTIPLFFLQRGYEKSSLFSLNDEDELTHYGQSLSEIEKFEDPVVSDDEDDEDKGKIGGN